MTLCCSGIAASNDIVLLDDKLKRQRRNDVRRRNAPAPNMCVPLDACSTGNGYHWRHQPSCKKHRFLAIKLFQLRKCLNGISPLIELGCHRTTRTISNNPMAPSLYNPFPRATRICASLALTYARTLTPVAKRKLFFLMDPCVCTSRDTFTSCTILTDDNSLDQSTRRDVVSQSVATHVSRKPPSTLRLRGIGFRT